MSDTKLDQEKEIVYVMTEGGDDFTSQVSTTEGNQTCIDEGVNNNMGPVSTQPSTMLSTPASNGLVDTVNQTDQQTQEENIKGDRETLPDNISNHTSQNNWYWQYNILLCPLSISILCIHVCLMHVCVCKLYPFIL